MLDQNTDRMWFVIGAVIVGAAIIFIANGTIPEIFASITDSFEEVSTDAIGVMDEIQPNIAVNMLSGVEMTRGYQLQIDGNGLDKDTYDATSDYMPAEPGQTYVFTTPVPTVVKRVVYFNENKDNIGGFLERSGLRLESTAPEGTVYVRVSTDYNHTSPEHTPIDTWWFGKIEHEEGGV